MLQENMKYIDISSTTPCHSSPAVQRSVRELEGMPELRILAIIYYISIHVYGWITIKQHCWQSQLKN